MIDFAQVLRVRGATANSTWLRSDNSELLIVLPDDETAIKALCDEFEYDYSPIGGDQPNWIRVARLSVNGKSITRIDAMFVPYFCGLIDQGRLTKIS